jgi:hypothetical protein
MKTERTPSAKSAKPAKGLDQGSFVGFAGFVTGTNGNLKRRIT